MRHGKKFNHLGRKAAHRKAMLANMACSLIEHKKIKTTLAKAKALRLYVEPLITKSKNDTTHSRRTVFSYLKQKEAITELFGDVASKVSERPGGYTRILKLSNRLGDNAQMAFIELVDYNETYTTDKPKKKKARRSGGSKTTETAVVTETVVAEEVATENVTTEVVEVEEKTEEVVETAEVVEETVAEVTEEKDITDVVEVEEKTEEVVETAEVVEETVDEVTEEKDTTEEIKEEESNDSSEEEKSE